MIIPKILLKWREPKAYFKISKLTNKKSWRYWFFSWLTCTAMFSVLLILPNQNKMSLIAAIPLFSLGGILITGLYYCVDNYLRPEVKIFQNKKQTWFLKTNGVEHKQIYFKDLECYAIDRIRKNDLESDVLLLILKNGTNKAIGIEDKIIPEIKSIMQENGIKELQNDFVAK